MKAIMTSIPYATSRRIVALGGATKFAMPTVLLWRSHLIYGKSFQPSRKNLSKRTILTKLRYIPKFKRSIKTTWKLQTKFGRKALSKWEFC